MRYILKMMTVLFVLIFSQTVSANNKLIYGADLKIVAEKYLTEKGILHKVLVSDKRAYFPCAEKIFIAPKNPNDWNTIKASCGNPERWSVSLRTKEFTTGSAGSKDVDEPVSIKIVYTNRNIPKGKVIQPKDLVLKWANSRSSHGAYLKIENVVGRKAKRNMSGNIVIKAHHVLANNAVNKNDTILIISGSAGLSIVAYGEALSEGKVGDMVLVKNLSSNRKFKAIVTSEKKVSPITNIN